jgi:hypothetical protein
MGLPELPVVNIFSNATYGVVGFVATIIVIAKLSQDPNVSMAYDRNYCSRLNICDFSSSMQSRL